MTDSIAVFPPGQRMLDADGAVISGAVLTFFAAGTTTPRTVYSDSGLSTSLGTSVTCDSGGYPTSDGNAKVQIWTGTTAYKVVCKTSAGVPVWSQDDISGAVDTTPFAAATFAKPDTDCAADTSNTTLTTTELGTVRNGNPTGGTFTYTLPSAITASNGRGYTFRHVGTANSIIIATVSAQTIDGATTKTLSGKYESVTIVSDGANWHIQQDANRTVVGGPLQPQGYLTPTSLTPVITGDVVAATSVYYTPYVGDLLPIYDGTRWVMYEFAELTLALASQHTLSSHFDVFAWLEAGVVTIGTGPAWSTITAGSGARGTGAGTTQLSLVKGLLTNTVSMTTRNGGTTYSVAASRATYLGSLFIDGTAGQVTCHVTYGQNRKWAVWNAYNQRPIILRGGESTASWTSTTSAAWQSANASASNKATVFCGLPTPLVANLYGASSGGIIGTQNPMIGIGYNATNALAGTAGKAIGNANGNPVSIAPAAYDVTMAIGIHNVNALEQTSSTSGTTFYGTEANQRLVCRYQG